MISTTNLFILVALLQYVTGTPPHIIMIVADDLGFNDVSFHGSDQIPTPNIDYLARNGVILNDYYVLPNCSPTRSAIMTGRYPIHTGMQSGTIYGANAWGVDPKQEMLPGYLKTLGYHTHAIGKWHLGFFGPEYTPTHRGFDTFYGFYGGQSDYWDHSLASNDYWGLDLHRDTPTSSETVWNQWGNYSSNMFSKEAVDRIRNHDPTEPMFLYLAYQSVHSANLAEDPLQAPSSWLQKFKHIRHIGRRKYAAMVAAMDYGIGKVYKALSKRGMLDNSVIIFTSDNGGPANGLNRNWATNYPLRGAKTTVYEGGVRAAACVYSKFLKYPGRVSKELMHATDWLPTLLHLAGHADVKNIDGMNLWQTLQAIQPSPRKEVLIAIDPDVYHNAALRIGEWKLVNQSRFYDGWYRPPGTWRNKKKRNLTNQVDVMRDSPTYQNARIDCGMPKPAIVPHCGGKKYLPCLFNINDDPCEFVDLSNQYPIIYNLMLSRLDEYRKGMVKSRRTTYRDPEANPKKHNGVWRPWKQLAAKSFRSSFSSFFQLPYSIRCHFV